MQKLTFKVKGVAALLLHNGRTANPMDPYAKAMKEISGKRKKTDSDYEKLSDLELEAGLYFDDDGKIYFPALNIEQAIIGGAKKSSLGKEFLKAIAVDGVGMYLKNGRQYTKEQVMSNEKYRYLTNVRVKQSRIVRTRPRFDEWNGEFDVLYNENLLNQDQVVGAVIAAGDEVGFGDWRPRFGRFEVEEVLEH